MDIIFGTYTCPDHEPDAFGIEEEAPKAYIGLMVYPLLPKKWGKKLLKKEIQPEQTEGSSVN